MVIRSGDGHRVDAVRHRVEHLTIIGEYFGVREAVVRLALHDVSLVDVTDRDDVAVIGRVGGIAAPFAVHTDAGVANALIGGPFLRPHLGATDVKGGADGGGRFDEVSTTGGLGSRFLGGCGWLFHLCIKEKPGQENARRDEPTEARKVTPDRITDAERTQLTYSARSTSMGRSDALMHEIAHEGASCWYENLGAEDGWDLVVESGIRRSSSP